MTTDSLMKDWRVELREWLKDHPKTEPADLRQLREEFLRRFPKEKIGELTLKQYAEGLGSKDTFCYWLEIKTKKLGGIQGATAAKFGVWWSRRDNTWKWVKRYQSAEEALSQFRRGFIELIRAAEGKRHNLLRTFHLQSWLLALLHQL
jgi:5-methylcytosine-specific restriction protein B